MRVVDALEAYACVAVDKAITETIMACSFLCDSRVLRKLKVKLGCETSIYCRCIA